MHKFVIFIVLLLLLRNVGSAQGFVVDTIQYHGSTSKYINVCILGDGYTATQQARFTQDANNLRRGIFGQRPWVNYSNYFNIFAIHTISRDSGAKHPNISSDCATTSPKVPTMNPDNFFGSSFDLGGPHRALVVGNTARVDSVLMVTIPDYDIIYVLSNSPYYGGTGGKYATGTTNDASNEVFAHELGHTYAGLADEYWAGAWLAIEKPNMTQEDDTTRTKWKHWFGTGNGIGIVPFNEDPSWFRPINDQCKMNRLYQPYCSVCYEGIIERIHQNVSPIVAYTPENGVVKSDSPILPFKLTELIKPSRNTLRVQWFMDNTLMSRNTDTLDVDQAALSAGTHTLVVEVLDTTEYVRDPEHTIEHLHTVRWTITRTISGVDIAAEQNHLGLSVSPLPASGHLNLSMESETPADVTIALYATDGSKVMDVARTRIDGGRWTHQADIGGIAAGAYTLVFTVNGFPHSRTIIVE